MKTTQEERNKWLQLIYQGDEECAVSALRMARIIEDFAELESKLDSARAVIQTYASDDNWADFNGSDRIWDGHSDYAGPTLAHLWLIEHPEVKK